MLKSPLTRSRVLKRAPGALKPSLAARSLRGRIVEALSGFGDEERAVLSMLLVERLTIAEAAEALGCDASRVRLAYRSLLAALRRTLGARSNASRFGEPRARLVLPARRRAA
jgi:DNA-directed RNA polymerase specialized sigma24 family protein